VLGLGASAGSFLLALLPLPLPLASGSLSGLILWYLLHRKQNQTIEQRC
jgi:hypothetical protein